MSQDVMVNLAFIDRISGPISQTGARMRYVSANEAWRLALRILKKRWLSDASRREFEQWVDYFADARNAALMELRR